MNAKKIIVVLIIILVIALIGFLLFKKKAVAPAPKIASFEECARAGYPVLGAYPKQCKTPDGKIFVEQVVQNSPEIIPGVKSLLYKNSEFGFSIWYPEGSSVREEDFNGFLNATSGGAAAVGIYLENSLFQGTNLGEGVVSVGISSDPDAVAKCIIPVDVQEQARGTANINGVAFNIFESIGVAAGNTYESKNYRTIRNGSCYEAVEMLHSGNIGNYTSGIVTEFDKSKFSGILEKIAKTFAFIDNSASGAMGTVTLGPICPVERIPPDYACAPHPYETEITITKSGFTRQIKNDSAGRFKADLDPGSYEFQAKGGAMFPRCNPVSVEIKPQHFNWVSISCDTGIR